MLQDRQQKIRQIQNETRTLPLQRKQLGNNSPRVRPGLEAIKDKARHVEVDRKKMELDVATRETSIARLKTQQYETRKTMNSRRSATRSSATRRRFNKSKIKEFELMEQGDKLKAEIGAEETKAVRRKNRSRDNWLILKKKALRSKRGCRS